MSETNELNVSGLVGTKRDSVRGQQVSQAIEQLRAGAALDSIKRGLPTDVRKEIDAIVERSRTDMAQQRQLRRARINELLVQDDPDLVSRAIALSQKEEGPTAPGVQVNIQANHWAEPPDGGSLEADATDRDE